MIIRGILIILGFFTTLANLFAFAVGDRIQAAVGGANVRDHTLANIRFTQSGGVHGTITAGPVIASAGDFTGNWWEIRWDSQPPIHGTTLGWSAESVISLAPSAGDIPQPSFSSSYYTTANIFWRNGYAPASTSPQNPRLGSALGNCTWYAHGRMRQLGYDATKLDRILGDASLWDNQALDNGINVDSTPTVGSIAQTDSGAGGLGHVAVVESLNANGTITITESSFSTGQSSTWNFLWRHRTVSPSWFQRFIHIPRNISGTWRVSFSGAAGGTCIWDIGQTGRDLSVAGYCDFAGAMNLSGVIDPEGRSFSVSGPTAALCGTATISGSMAREADVMSGTWLCAGYTGTFVGSRNVITTPKLQTDIANGYYTSSTETIIAPAKSFTLYTLYNSPEMPSGTYYLSAAVVPRTSNPPITDFGSFTVNGYRYSAANMIYGNPPAAIVDSAYDLPAHGIFETHYFEIGFTFDIAKRAQPYNSQDDPGGLVIDSSNSATMFWEDFVINVGDMAPSWNVHFDLYQLTTDERGNLMLKDHAPFSHDAEGAAGDLLLTPATATWQGNIPNNPTADQVELITGTSAQLTLAYKNDETGPFAGSYSTVYFNTSLDPSTATITYTGGSAIADSPIFLLVKDGTATPVWYLFNISGWNGTDRIQLEGFWPQAGAISAITIFSPQDEPSLLSVTIQGESDIQAGELSDYGLLAQFSDGTTKDVSSEAAWSIVSDKPEGTAFFKNTLVAGLTQIALPVQIQAAFSDSNGKKTSRPFTVTLQPRFTVTFAFRISELEGLAPQLQSASASSQLRRVDLNASSFGPNGEAVKYEWDLNNNGIFDDATGSTISYQFQAGNSYPVAVRGFEFSGSSATEVQPITIDRLSVGNANSTPAWTYPIEGFYDSRGNLVAHADPAKKESGLVVIVHGLCSSSSEEWVKTMARAIEARLPTSVPNVVVYDWNRDAALLVPLVPCPVTLYAAAKLTQLEKKQGLGMAHGITLADWIMQEITLHNIDSTKPIHLVGHSAGGWVVGECAKRLPEMITQVTMLDTPFPAKAHFNGTSAIHAIERYITSIYGQAAHGHKNYAPELEEIRPTLNRYLCPLCRQLVFTPEPSTFYYRQVLGSGDWRRHNDAYEWYTKTVTNSTIHNGFYFSPLLGNGFHLTESRELISAFASEQAAIEREESLERFSTAGNVVNLTNLYRIKEEWDAGIFKTVALPIGVQALRFRYRFEAAGDGDFLAVYWGTNEALYIGPDLPLTRDNFMDAELAVSDYAGETNMLIFKLVSRGGTNAVLLLDQIRISLSSDADGDGLSNDEEAILATNPLALDTDGDEISDNDEVNVYQSNPLLKDSDGDGLDDPREIVAGTNPNDPASALKITAVMLSPPNGLRIDWLGSTNVSYRVNRSSYPSRENYTTLTNGLPGHPLTTFVDASPTNGTAFYWIEVQ